MSKDELLKLLRVVIGEERGVFLCEIFEDSAGKAIQIRYRIEPELLRSACDEILKIYKALQKAGMQDYSLGLFLVDKTGSNRYFLQAKIGDKRPMAIGLKEAGNRWCAEIIHVESPAPQTEKLLLDLEIVGGVITLGEDEKPFWDALMARVRR